MFQKNFLFNFISKISLKNLFLLNLILITFFLFPILQSGYLGDDAYNSQIKGRVIQDGINVFNFWLGEVSSWYWNNGRLYPLSFYAYFLFYFVENIFIYKIFVLFLIFLNTFYFRKIIFYETQSESLANISSLFIIIFFQITPWHNSLLSFHGLIPMITLFFFISFNHYQIFLMKNIKKNLYFSAFFFLITLLLYEISYLFILIFFFYKFKNKELKKKFLDLKIHIIFLLLCIVLVLIARIKIYITGELFYPSIEKNFLLKNFLIAIFYQIIGTFPLISSVREIALDIFYFNNIFNFKHIINILINKFINYKNFIFITDFFFILTYFYILDLLLKKKINYKFKSTTLIIFGTLLILLPSIVVGVSGHQNEIVKVGPGLAYLPVYLQYYGLCTIFFVFIIQNIRLFKNIKLRISFIIFLCLINYFQLLNSRVLVDNLNIKYKHPADLLEKSLNSGLLKDLDNNAIILNQVKIPADWIWSLSQKAKKKLNVCVIDTYKDCFYIQQLKENNSKNNYEFYPKNFYYLNYNYNHKSENNKVFIYKIEKIFFNDSKLITSITTIQEKYYSQNIKKVSKFENSNRNFIFK